MKNFNKRITGLLLVLAAFTLSGCGSDTDPVYDAVVTLTVTYNGTGSAETIGAIDVDIDLPTGFDLETEADGKTPTVDAVSTAEGMPVDTLIAARYESEALPTLGQLFAGLASAQGFAVGPFITITRPLATGEVLPDPADFVKVQFDVYDANIANPNLLSDVDYTLTVDVQKQQVTSQF